MSKASAESLEFAKQHISTFGDSDFFPTPGVYEALWGQWGPAKQFFENTNLENCVRPGTRVMPAPKSYGGFRMVHQLDPLSAVAYTALARMVAEDVENARAPIAEKVVLSYRLSPTEDSLFARGNGYSEFVEVCRECAANHKFVLMCDLADFYNSIYVHRVQNNIENSGAKKLSESLEVFLLKVNQNASQGIPVGPAASIVVSEAALIDVDEFLRARGLRYLRYVDDIRIFGNDEDQLLSVLEDLVAYLYDSHRLQLAWGKTRLLKVDEFVERHLDPPHRIEQRELLGAAREIVDYGDNFTHDHVPELVDKYMTADVPLPVPAMRRGMKNLFAAWMAGEESEKRKVRRTVLAQLLKYASEATPLDLGLARYALRRGRTLKVPDLIDIVLQRFDVLAPAAPDVFQYLHAVGAETVLKHDQSPIVALMTLPVIKRSRFLQHWLQWYYSSNAALLGVPEIAQYVFREAKIEFQAAAARKMRQVAWLRARKSDLGSMGPWDRWSTMLAAEAMASSEREPLLRSFVGPHSDPVDRIVADYVKMRP